VAGVLKAIARIPCQLFFSFGFNDLRSRG